MPASFKIFSCSFTIESGWYIPPVLDFLFEGRGSDDFNALFTIPDALSKLVAPFVEADTWWHRGATYR